MASRLGAELPRQSVAWFWFAVATAIAIVCAFEALTGSKSWVPCAIFAGIAVLLVAAPRLRRREKETIQLDDKGVLRAQGAIREQILWKDVAEIRIITTDEGPYRDDVFFVLAGANGTGCLVPHTAATRVKLFEELQARFPDLSNDLVVQAMASTSNNNFLVWKRREGDH